MSFDTEVLIIKAGSSGLGLAVQLIRKFGVRDFELIEKSEDVGGTWLANTYPGCGCDVASHFYSYSFALNPSWTRKYSMQSEIQAYFRSVAEQYRIVQHIRFHSSVEKAVWDEKDKIWVVTVQDTKNRIKKVRRAKIVVSTVGALSVPKQCDIPGKEDFKGNMFHSAQWDWDFDWKGKDVVVLAQYLSARENPVYSSLFKATMRYVPFAMRLYRFNIYQQMERDLPGLEIEAGKAIRANLAKDNAEYVKRTAPDKYWDALGRA